MLHVRGRLPVMTIAQVTINSEIASKLLIYFGAAKRFSKNVSMTLNPTNELTFSAFNLHKSCFATFNVDSSSVSKSNTSRISPDSEVFLQAYEIPLAPFSHFLQRSTSLEADVSIEFISFGITAFAQPLDDCTVFYKTQFEASNRLYLTAPPVALYPNHIIKCDSEWIFSLLHSVSRSSLQKVAVLSLHCIPGVGLRITGPEESQTIISHQSFVNFVAHEYQSVSVSLHEFVSFMILCKHFKSPMDIYFGSPGQPLIAVVGAIEGAKCEFIISTIPAATATTSPTQTETQTDEIITADITIPNSEAENDEDATDYEDF